jgi:twinkle protein
VVIRANSMFEKFKKICEGKTSRQALTTGYTNMDEYMKFAKGYFSVVTGYPGSGKSEWVDAVLLNMALMHEWKILYFSPENNPLEEHMAKIAEKYVGKPIKEFSHKDNSDAINYIDRHFSWIDPETPDLETIFNLARSEKQANGLDCLVIDPWNAISHKRGMLREDEYLMDSLSKILVFARKQNILVIVIAHPKTIPPDKDGKLPKPKINDVSGGTMWWNKADYGVICHRPNRGEHKLEVYVQKIKQKWMGQLGVTEFDYDWRTGRFKPTYDKEFTLPTDITPPF